MNEATAFDKYNFSTFAEYANESHLNLYGAETEENGDYTHADWFMTFEYNRDSDAYTMANLQVILEELEPHSEDFTTMEFGHPLCGWVGFIVCKANSKALVIVAESMCAIEEYPLLAEHRELVFHCTACNVPELTTEVVEGEDGAYCSDHCHVEHEGADCDECGGHYLKKNMTHADSEHGTFCDAECEADHIAED